MATYEQANNIKTYYYPEDLLTENEKYSKSYVIFYISAMKDTYATRNNTGGVASYLTNIDSSLSEGTTTAVSTGVGAAIGGATAAITGKGIGGIASGAITGAALAALSTIGGVAPLSQRENKQLVSAIALYTPNQLSIRHSAQWTETTAQSASLLKSMGGSFEDNMGSISSMVTGILESGAAAGGFGSSIALQTLPSRMPFGNDIFGSFSTSTGIAPNPKKEQMFQNMDFISFQLEFIFSPRNESEAKSVKDIIYQFKYHMHPEFAMMNGSDMGGFLYRYPSEFDILYYYDDEQNKNVHRHSTSVLVDMVIDYSPNGVYSVFPNGMPTQTKIVLTFRELVIRTKEIIDAEFGSTTSS